MAARLARAGAARIAKVGVLHPGQAANVSMRIAAIREGLDIAAAKE